MRATGLKICNMEMVQRLGEDQANLVPPMSGSFTKARNRGKDASNGKMVPSTKGTSWTVSFMALESTTLPT